MKKPKLDSRSAYGPWAPGNYTCTCVECQCQFYGDKRSVVCADCVYKKAGQKL